MRDPSRSGMPAADGAFALPPPDAAAREHSNRLTALIRGEIEARGGSIGFDRYMELALYAPRLGYYSAGAVKFGPAGDFVTAPEVSGLFGRCLAAQCAEVLERLGGGDILELGAGTGALAVAVLAALQETGALPERYRILELSAELRQRQRALIGEQAPGLRDRVQWLDRLPAPGFTGVVLANEVLDAMPVQCFAVRDGVLFERRVGVDGEGRPGWEESPAGEGLSQGVRHIEQTLGGPLPPNYVSELNPGLPAWCAGLGEVVQRGVMLLIDYGYPRREYYHPQRAEGTLLCHYRHRAHEDPFFWPGLQDISANVDFTAVAEAGQDGGWEVAGYTSQAQFLLATGIVSALEQAAGDRECLGYAQQIKRLTLPSEMGERFKVMALARGHDAPLSGFGLRDFRERL